MLRFGCGEYTIGATIGELPISYSHLVSHAVLHEDMVGGQKDGTLLCVTVGSAEASWPELIVTQRFDPGPDAGFHPGIFLVAVTHLLLIGAGTRVLAYDLKSFTRLWEDEADTGFWGWERHNDIIFMSAELELAAWDIHGRKLWTTFVEPPWEFTVQNHRVELDVMGKKSSFDARTGPR